MRNSNQRTHERKRSLRRAMKNGISVSAGPPKNPEETYGLWKPAAVLFIPARTQFSLPLEVTWRLSSDARPDEHCNAVTHTLPTAPFYFRNSIYQAVKKRNYPAFVRMNELFRSVYLSLSLSLRVILPAEKRDLFYILLNPVLSSRAREISAPSALLIVAIHAYRYVCKVRALFPGRVVARPIISAWEIDPGF